MKGIESALAEIEGRIADAQKAADALTKAMKQLRHAAQVGHIQNLEKGLQTIAQRGREADAAASVQVSKTVRLEAGLARFEARGPLYPDATRTWLTLEFRR